MKQLGRFMDSSLAAKVLDVSADLNNIAADLLRRGDTLTSVQLFSEALKLVHVFFWKDTHFGGFKKRIEKLLDGAARTLSSGTRKRDNYVSAKVTKAKRDCNGKYSEIIQTEFQSQPFKLQKKDGMDYILSAAIILFNSGLVHQKSESWTAAAVMFETTLRLIPAPHQSHINVALIVSSAHNNLGCARSRCGQMKEAVSYFLSSRRILETVSSMGQMSRAINTTVNLNLSVTIKVVGDLLVKKQKYAEAMRSYAHVLQLRHDYPEKSYVLSCLRSDVMHKIGLLHCMTGDFSRASTAFELSSKILPEEVMELKHSLDLASHLHKKGMGYKLVGDVEMALKFFQQAVKLTLTHFGPDHPHATKSLRQIASIHESQGNIFEALQAYQDLAQFDKLRYGKKHSQVAITLSKFGRILRLVGKPHKALHAFKEALSIVRGSTRTGNPQLICLLLSEIGSIYMDLAQFDDASTAYSAARRINDDESSLDLRSSSFLLLCCFEETHVIPFAATAA